MSEVVTVRKVVQGPEDGVPVVVDEKVPADQAPKGSPDENVEVVEAPVATKPVERIPAVTQGQEVPEVKDDGTPLSPKEVAQLEAAKQSDDPAVREKAEAAQAEVDARAEAAAAAPGPDAGKTAPSETEKKLIEAEAKRTRRTFDVSKEDFVKAHQESKTYDELVEKTGLPREVVLARASLYRRQGEQLNKLDRKNKAQPKEPAKTPKAAAKDNSDVDAETVFDS